jgi:tetratricopeptide (TPR) repeat protein
VLRQHLGVAAAPLGANAEFSQLLEIAATQTGVPVRGVVDATREAEQARFLLFDRCCEFLAVVARTRPTLVIIDDVQFADTGSLLLLQFLVARLAEIPIALFVTSRDPLSELTASTTRHPWSRYRVLLGLSRSETRTLLAAYVPAALRPSELDRVMHLTEGNPYFVKEVGHILAGGHQLVDRSEPMVWPASLLAVTLQPYHRLSAACRTLLETASVVGREFDTEVVAHAARVPVPDALLLLDEAVQHRVVASLGPGRYQFVHALVREAVRDQLHPSYRTRLHESIGLVLQQHASRGDPVSTAAIAHHFCNALPLTNRRQAAFYCMAAGTTAQTAFGFEEAVALFRRAQEISGSSLTELEQCDLLLHLGSAESSVGEWSRSRSTFEDAAAIARRVGCSARLARAALGFKGTMWATNPVDTDAVDLLEEALQQLGSKDAILQVELLSALSRSLYFSPDKLRARIYADRAVSLAFQNSNKRLQAVALEAQTVNLLQPGRSHELLKAAGVLVALGDRLRDAELRFNARIFRQHGLLTLGRLAEADTELEIIQQIVAAHPYPRFKWQLALLRVARATLQGNLDLADRLSASARDFGTRVHDTSPLQYQLLQGFQRAQLRNDISAWPAVAEQVLENLPDITATRVARAWLLARASHNELATEVLHSLSHNSFEAVPPNFVSLWLLSVLADAVSMVGNRPLASALYDLLRPHASQFIVAGWGTLIDGSVAYYLGLLAQCLGMHDAARSHFEASITANRNIGAPALTARSGLALSRHLLLFGNRSDVQLAHSLAEHAAGTFASLRLDRYAEQARDLCPPAEARQRHDAIATSSRNSFRRQGDFWNISYQGTAIHVRATLGFEYIARLLATPRLPIHVIDLITCHANLPMSVSAGASDIRAFASYRNRIKEIESALADAESNHDLGLMERLADEREQLLNELSHSFSRTGAPRPYRSDTERARISVRNRISAAIKSVQRFHPDCAMFLRRSIKTGSLCVYDPIQSIHWDL